MGTVVKDEAAILKALKKNPKGIRSTDLWFAVHGSVRSLTTFQKRLKHLEQKGRIQTNDDLDDMRVKIITPTPKSQEASNVLEAIDLLERLYLGKSSPKVIRSTWQLITRPGLPTEKTQDHDLGAGNLLLIAQETYLKSWKDKPPDVGDSGVYLWAHAEKAEDGSPQVHIHDLPKSILDKWGAALEKTVDLGKQAVDLHTDVQKQFELYKQLVLLMAKVRQAVEAGSTPEKTVDECRQIVDEWSQITEKCRLVSLDTIHGETISS